MDAIMLSVGQKVDPFFKVEKWMQGYRMEMDGNFGLTLLIMMPGIKECQTTLAPKGAGLRLVESHLPFYKLQLV